jgi:dipeptidyl aminopeptidase/acylaminoacyl peptidase
MAHFSYASPDKRWALIVEMDEQPRWLPCRVVPLDGSSAGRQVGPEGECTSAGWSPDGRWMYLGIDVVGDRQLWRQRFPDGVPEQITFGPTQASGIAVSPDGRSLITSIGLVRSLLWLREPSGERRALSTEGIVSSLDLSLVSSSASGSWSSGPTFSPDGREIYYLWRRQPTDAGFKLWRVDLESGAREPLLADRSVHEYDLSEDGREVVFSTGTRSDSMQIWLASTDLASAPRKLVEGSVDSPHFGADGTALFRFTEGSSNYLYRVNRDGSERARVAPYPINTLQSSSPDGRWLAALLGNGATFVLPSDGGPPARMCAGTCAVRWAPDGEIVYVRLGRPSRDGPAPTLAIPANAWQRPDFPVGGLSAKMLPASLANSVLVDATEIVPGPNPSTYAYVETTIHQNLFRISLP